MNKMEFGKRKTQGQQGKTEQEEETDFKQKCFGGTKEETPLKLQENNLLGAFSPPKRTKKTKRPPPPKKNLLHVGKQTQIFGKFLLFFNLHSFISAKLCFAENTIKKCLQQSTACEYHR